MRIVHIGSFFKRGNAGDIVIRNRCRHLPLPPTKVEGMYTPISTTSRRMEARRSSRLGHTFTLATLGPDSNSKCPTARSRWRARAARDGLSVVELSGKAGDVYLVDMRTLHTPSLSEQTYPNGRDGRYLGPRRA